MDKTKKRPQESKTDDQIIKKRRLELEHASQQLERERNENRNPTANPPTQQYPNKYKKMIKQLCNPTEIKDIPRRFTWGQHNWIIIGGVFGLPIVEAQPKNGIESLSETSLAVCEEQLHNGKSITKPFRYYNGNWHYFKTFDELYKTLTPAQRKPYIQMMMKQTHRKQMSTFSGTLGEYDIKPVLLINQPIVPNRVLSKRPNTVHDVPDIDLAPVEIKPKRVKKIRNNEKQKITLSNFLKQRSDKLQNHAKLLSLKDRAKTMGIVNWLKHLSQHQRMLIVATWMAFEDTLDCNTLDEVLFT